MQLCMTRKTSPLFLSHANRKDLDTIKLDVHWEINTPQLICERKLTNKKSKCWRKIQICLLWKCISLRSQRWDRFENFFNICKGFYPRLITKLGAVINVKTNEANVTDKMAFLHLITFALYDNEKLLLKLPWIPKKLGQIRVDTQSIGLCLQYITNFKNVARHSIYQKNGMQNVLLSDSGSYIKNHLKTIALEL